MEIEDISQQDMEYLYINYKNGAPKTAPLHFAIKIFCV